MVQETPERARKTLFFRGIGLFPGADAAAGFVEKPLVVAFAKVGTGLGCELGEARSVHVVDLEIALLVLRGYFVGAEEETAGVAIDDGGGGIEGFGRGNEVFGDFVPGDVDVDVAELGVGEDAVDDSSLVVNGVDDAAQSAMSPNDGGARVAFEELD